MASEAGEIAVDSSVAPSRIIGSEAKDELSDIDRCCWSSWASGGLCPVQGDASSVPSQEGVGGDEPAFAFWGLFGSERGVR